MEKVSRNAPCPCGSRRKFKKCHGSGQPAPIQSKSPTPEALAALEIQRQRQQGEGRPIISAEAFGYRFVAVKGRLHYSQSKNWQTVPGFLSDYLKTTMGKDWGEAELKKSLEERHPILQWYQRVCEQQREAQPEPGKSFTTPMTGAIAAYLHLAYDLFTL